MSLETQQATESPDSTADDGSRTFTEELKIICTLWILGAILAGIGFVAVSDVFAGLA